MAKDVTSACLAGLLASGLFIFVFGMGLGFIFMFLPTLPLFFIGLSKKSPGMRLAVLITAMIIALIAGLPMAVVFLLFLGIPSWYMSKYSLLCQINMGIAGQMGMQPKWFPIGTIILYLALYGCAMTALTTLYYVTQGNSLPQILSQNIHAAFADLQNDYGDVINMLAGELSFLMFPITLWLWGILLYGHAWLTNRVLARQGLQLRPNFAVDIFIIPKWMFSLLAISALASLIGSESMSFLGKTTMLSLMLPYFFLGASVMHAACKNIPSQKFILFFVYFIIASQFWPALILAGVGLWHQIKSFCAPPPQKEQ